MIFNDRYSGCVLHAGNHFSEQVSLKTLLIDDTTLQAAQLAADELRLEIAVLLFQQERLTLAQAARLAELDYLGFQQILAGRKIAVHYGEHEFAADLIVGA